MLVCGATRHMEPLLTAQNYVSEIKPIRNEQTNPRENKIKKSSSTTATTTTIIDLPKTKQKKNRKEKISHWYYYTTDTTTTNWYTRSTVFRKWFKPNTSANLCCQVKPFPFLAYKMWAHFVCCGRIRFVRMIILCIHISCYVPNKMLRAREYTQGYMCTELAGSRYFDHYVHLPSKYTIKQTN